MATDPGLEARYGTRVHWLETAPFTPRPDLREDLDVDVAIVGAGFTGLWTACHLLEAEPATRVAVVEAEEIGFGASGRNGGFAMTLLDMSLAHLRRNHGDDAARVAHEAVAVSVEEMGKTVASESIDCDWHHGGLMVVATSPGQMARVRADLDAAGALGLDDFTPLSSAAARARVDSPTYVGGLYEDHCAVVHPAKLVRGIADLAERRGALLFERSPVDGIRESSGRVVLTSERGSIRADQVVLATNAWAVGTPWHKHRVVPLYTYVVLTEPLSDAQWARVGWEGFEGVEDKRNYVHYYRRTADGRILWGGSDGVVYRGGRIGAGLDVNAKVRDRLHSTFRTTFPQLADVGFTHHWGGPVGITPSFMPICGTLLDGRLHYGLGYNGHGVAPSHTVAKVLRDKVLHRRSPLSELCFVDSDEKAFPPEPLRWIGAELTRRALLRQDAALDAGADAGEMDPLLLRFVNKLS
ncbi:MAG: FAD-binding oxidoreductase [Acidimicrobiia bacterium]|nr:FAD-binding oxidoreductase [Acidimicrobiia bacterium]